MFLEWTASDIKWLDIAKIYTEITELGLVVREVGLDSNGLVVHKSPSSISPRGYFDLAKISFDKKKKSDISSHEFEKLWNTTIKLQK